jgi:2,3-bisphosphoglycerate-independent phosphoglycerate mutase
MINFGEILSMNSIKNLSSKALLVILDGFGISKPSPSNAITNANTPNIDYLFNNFPFATLEAGGQAVGLPNGIAGNSEVGHMNLGAGRPVEQDLVRINQKINDDTLKEMPQIKALVKNAQETTKRIHLMGLFSDGGVHSDLEHLKYLINYFSQVPNIEIYFHAFMDGRDTPIDKGIQFIEQMKNTPGFILASMQGRSFGMDRDRRWEKIELSYKTLTGFGDITELNPTEYISQQYSQKIFDEFITPTLFDKSYAIQNNDSIFFINFRPDRAVQLSLCFTMPAFSEFKRDISPSFFLCMTPYIQDEVELPILFDKDPISNGLTSILSERNKKQFKIAETEKYAHVTYFFNGGRKESFPGEKQVLIPSTRDVPTYDLKPEMSAFEITTTLIEELNNNKFDFYLVNFANADMVGHTGNYSAAIKAIETLDSCLGQLKQTCFEQNITLMITADHGNSDQMKYKNGAPNTSHSKAKVPFAVIHPKLEEINLGPSSTDLALKDVAPTICYVMGEDIPNSFTGKTIFN